MNYTLRSGVILHRLHELPWASLITLEPAFAGFWPGLRIALILAAMRTSCSRVAHGFSGAYVTFLTNSPVLIHICILHYGLPESGIVPDNHAGVIIGLITATSAYASENLQAVFASVR